MNSIFNLPRFAKLFLLDISNSKIIYLGILIAIFTLNLLFTIGLADYDLSVGKGTFLGLSLFAGFAAPFMLYRDITHKIKGTYYVMRPASVLEKFLCYLLNCAVIIPVICVAGYVLSILFFNAFFAEYSFPGFTFIDYIFFIFYQAVGLLGNVFFRHLKFLKTIGFITICMFTSLIFIVTLSILNYSTLGSVLLTEEANLGVFILNYLQTTQVKIVMFILNIMFPFGIWVAAFFKMKELEY